MIPYLKPPRESSVFVNYFEALVAFGGRPTKVVFAIKHATVSQLERPLAHVLENSEAILAEVTSAIETELLAYYNDNCRCYVTEAGELVERPVLTLQEFLATINLDEIEVSDCMIELWYTDGELFQNRLIHLSAPFTTDSDGVDLGSFTASLDKELP